MTTLASALLCISNEAHVVLATPGPLRLEVRLPPVSDPGPASVAMADLGETSVEL